MKLRVGGEVVTPCSDVALVSDIYEVGAKMSQVLLIGSVS